MKSLFLFFLFLINKYYTFELVLKLDFSSNIYYENYQCGGDLYVDDIKFEVYQNSTLPPCKTFSDIGERLSDFQINNNYINMSLLIVVYNYNNNSIYSKNNSAIGTIRSFCNVEIIINPNNSSNYKEIITIDGSNSNSPFIAFQNTLYTTTCENNYIGLKLKNLKFINWNYYPIIEYSVTLSNWKYRESENSWLFFNYITVINSSSFFNCFGNINTTISIKNCNFSNINSSRNSFILIYEGRTTINNCIFQNSFLNTSFLIDYGGDNIVLNDCKFINITMSYYSLLFFSATNTLLKNINVEKCNLNDLFLKLKTTREMNQFNFNQTFIELLFNDNYFSNPSLNEAKSLINYIQFDQDFTNETIGEINITFNNFQITNSNKIDNGINLLTISFNFSNHINIINSTINSNQFNNLINTNYSIIEINNTIFLNVGGGNGGDSSYENSKLIIGLNNTILINDNILNSDDLIRNIKNGCTNCTIIINTKLKNDDNYDFKKFDIIPTVLVPSIVLLVFIILLIFRNNLKKIFKKNNNKNNNNNINNNRDLGATTDVIGSNSQREINNNSLDNEPHIDN
ncbi:hypothetical protein ACTFIV_008185 [Dictyostelium citrinum]